MPPIPTTTEEESTKIQAVNDFKRALDNLWIISASGRRGGVKAENHAKRTLKDLLTSLLGRSPTKEEIETIFPL